MFLRVFYAIMIFPALSLSIYFSIASTYMLFFMRLRAFALASATIFAAVDYLIMYLVDINPNALFIHDLHLPKSTLQLLLFFCVKITQSY